MPQHKVSYFGRAVLLVATATLAIAILYVLYVHVRNTCPFTSGIETEKEAIAQAKKLLHESTVLYFDGIGNTHDFIKSIENDVRCCQASRDYSLPYLSHIWNVDLTHANSARTGYHINMEISQCGKLIRVGKIPP